MTFGRPEALMLAPALGGVLLGALWLYWRRARRLVEALGGAEPALRLTGRRLDRAPRARAALLGCGAVTLALAAADLRTGTVGTQGSGATDVVLVLDASLSMSADDVGPTRLGRAKAIAAELARAPGDGYTGLVVFAGWPYELVPLTDDLDVIDFFLAPMGAELFPEADRGTSLAVAISQARRTLAARARPGVEQAVVLLSDGELHDGLDAVRDSATAAFAAGVRVWTAGIGTPAGREISTPTGEPLLDASGRPVRSRLDEDVLTAVARAGGGSFVRADRDGAATLARGLGRGSPGGTAPDLAWLLLVVALGAIACEGALDAGRLPLARSTR